MIRCGARQMRWVSEQSQFHKLAPDMAVSHRRKFALLLSRSLLIGHAHSISMGSMFPAGSKRESGQAFN